MCSRERLLNWAIAQLSEIALSGEVEVNIMLYIFFTNKKSTSNHIKFVLKALIYTFFEVKKYYEAEEQLQGTFQADMGSNRIQHF